jgi:hypothetical protein
MADFQEIYGIVFQIYLEVTFTFPIIVILSDLHTTHYVPVVPNVAREEDGTTSPCVERQDTQRVRVDRLRPPVLRRFADSNTSLIIHYNINPFSDDLKLGL